jgi:[ribosomal protein S18]-alanine N-acetyltransferase
MPITQISARRLPVHIRWMITRDMPEVMAIEQAGFPEFPWSEEDFRRCLRQRNCIGMVAEAKGPVLLDAGEGRDGRAAVPESDINWDVEVEFIAGFMVYELHKTRLHLMNLAVDPRCQRRGVGRQLVEKLTGKLSFQRRCRLTLEVRETNLDAQLFFRACGLRAVSVLPGFYEDTPEDAYRFQARATVVSVPTSAGSH